MSLSETRLQELTQEVAEQRTIEIMAEACQTDIDSVAELIPDSNAVLKLKWVKDAVYSAIWEGSKLRYPAIEELQKENERLRLALEAWQGFDARIHGSQQAAMFYMQGASALNYQPVAAATQKEENE